MYLFFRRAESKVIGLTATYVDDTLACGDREFYKLTERTQDRFETKPREKEQIHFAGVYINKDAQGYRIHQSRYIDRLTNLPNVSDFSNFRKARATLSWVIHSRSDVCVNVNKLAKVSEEQFERKHIKLLNSTVKYLMDTKDFSLLFPRLDTSSLQIRALSDASFTTNADQ